MPLIEFHNAADLWWANLVSDMNDSQLTIDLDNGGDGAPDVPFKFSVDSEIIRCSQITEDTPTGDVDRFTITRGEDGTIAVEHTQDTAIVRGTIFASHINELQQSLIGANQLWAQNLGGDITTTQVITISTDGGTWLHTVEQSSPDLTVKLKAGAGLVLGQIVRQLADEDTAEFTAPVGDDRIDIIQTDPAGTNTIKTGTPAGSPTAPTPDSGNAVRAEVYNRPGQTSVKNEDDLSNGYITMTLLYK